MLEYGKRKMRGCADTFQNLAQIFGAAELHERETVERSEVQNRLAGLQKSETRAGDEFERGAAGGANRRTVCVEPPEMPADRPGRLISTRLSEGRQVFAGNFREIAEMMNAAAEESVRFISLGKKRQKQILRGLAGEGILARDLYLVQRSDGRLELSISLACRNGICRTADEAADYLSVLLDMRMVSARRNPFFIGNEYVSCSFQEEPAYSAMTGTARAVKETENRSGDNFSFFEAGDGNLTAILSDGMGSGEDACRDSEAVTDMAESFLETGIAPQMAVQLVNSALISGENSNHLPTLDLCSIDLYEGKCQFLKTGAAASFIKRGCAVETIPAGSLPLGTFGNVQTECTRREVSDGDMIIMVSDGMVENLPGNGGEEKLRRFLADTDVVSPTEMANRLLRYVIEGSGGRIRDDMTVLVIGIWEEQGELG